MKLKYGLKLTVCSTAVNHEEKENSADAGKNCTICTSPGEI